MKCIVLLLLAFSLAQSAPKEDHDEHEDEPKTFVCNKYKPINVTADQLAGEWFVQAYGFNGNNTHHLKCQKRKFNVNPDGLTGILETNNFDDEKQQNRMFKSPFFEAKPGVFLLGHEPKSARTRSLVVLHLDDNVLAYQLVTSNCGHGKTINEPRIAVRKVDKLTLPELETIFKGLPVYPDFKELKEIPHKDCKY